MKRPTLGILGVGTVVLLLVLMAALPVSAMGGSGNHNGAGNHASNAVYHHGSNQQNGCDNGICVHENCPYNGAQPRDGSGMKCGQSGRGCDNDISSGSGGQGHGHRFSF